MPKNENGKYRDYDDDDIDGIWTIRILQGMGYSIKEIVNMVNDEEFNFEESIAQKISELEEKMKKTERHLGYAKMIKLTGRFPARPRKMGEVTCEEFQEEALKNWNIVDNPKDVEYARFAEIVLSKSSEEWKDSELGCILSALENMLKMDTDFLLAEYVLPKAILKRKNLGAGHPDIQYLIKLIYENQKELCAVDGIESSMTVQQFSRFYSSSYLFGDIAKLKQCDFNKEDCEFIAEAVSIFGGYKNHDELLEEELRYGR